MIINQNPGLNKPDFVGVSIHNADTVVIPTGAPVVLVMNGTNDGLDVVLPSTQNSNLQTFGLIFGVNAQSLAVGAWGQAIVYGLSQSLLLVRQTRVSSSNVWNSEAIRSVGEFLTADTVNNGFITMASAVSAVTASASAAQNQVDTRNPMAVLGQSLNSYSSSASSTADTRTAITAAVKAFVRIM